jgi:hypothetical protein
VPAGNCAIASALLAITVTVYKVSSDVISAVDWYSIVPFILLSLVVFFAASLAMIKLS